MEIKELPDFKDDWNVAYQDNNLDLLEYVVEVANKFHPSVNGYGFSQSEDPVVFNNRYIESTLGLHERYDRIRSMGYLKDTSWEEYEKNNSNTKILDTSFRDKFIDRQLQNTIAAYNLDVSKFWYLILYINDFVKDRCVNAYKVGDSLIDLANELNKELPTATEIIIKKNNRNCFSSSRKHVIDIVSIAMQHLIHDYNDIIESKSEDWEERLKQIGLDFTILHSCELNPEERINIDKSYRQYKFAEMLLYFLKDKKGVNPPNAKEKVYKEKHFFISMLLYVVGLYDEDEETAKNKWYEPYYNEKENRNLSNLVRNYKNRKFKNSAPKIYVI